MQTTTTTRRAVLAGTAALPAAALPAAALPALAMPALAAVSSAVRRRFEDWKRLHARANEPVEDDVPDELINSLMAAELALYNEPSCSAADLALKHLCLAAGEFSLRVDERDIAALTRDANPFLAAEGIKHLVAPVMPPEALTAADDPAVAAYAAWSAAQQEWLATDEEDKEAGRAAFERQYAAELTVCETVPTTAAGAADQVRLAIDMVEQGQMADNRELTLLASLLAGLERMSAV